MTQEAKSVNDRAIRKLLMAFLFFSMAMAWTLFTPSAVTAQSWEDCSNMCEDVCESVGSSCLGFFYSEGMCDFGCN